MDYFYSLCVLLLQYTNWHQQSTTNTNTHTNTANNATKKKKKNDMQCKSLREMS